MEQRLNELFGALGQIQNEQQSCRRDHERTLEILDDLSERIRPLDQLIATVTEMRPYVQDLYVLKQRGIGIVVAVGFLGTVFGWVIDKILGNIK